MTAPNGIWTTDFKGQFKTRNGVYCYPLTIVDGFSRYLLACQGLLSTAVSVARPTFLRLFREYGLPDRIRTDNGVPFATTALGRLSTLSVWWIRLGIRPELIEHWVCVTHTLAGEYVGLEEVDDGLWDVYFGPITLGRMDERILRIEDHKGRTVRKQVSPMSPD
jgi:hypothetical protein